MQKKSVNQMGGDKEGAQPAFLLQVLGVQELGQDQPLESGEFGGRGENEAGGIDQDLFGSLRTEEEKPERPKTGTANY